MPVIESNNTIDGVLGPYRNAGAPSNGTSAIHTVTIEDFAACVLLLKVDGYAARIVFTGSEDNTAIDNAVTAALEALSSVGTGGVSVAVTGTTDREIAITFTGNNAKKAVALIQAEAGEGSAVPAALSTNLTGDNNDLVFAAREGGAAGNDIEIAYVDPAGNDELLSVDVAGTEITVNLATSGDGSIISTASQIAAEVANTNEANALVSVANKSGNNGSGVVIAMTSTNLTGGADAPGVSVAETTPGVTATARGAGKGATLLDTTNGKEYINTGTPLEPTWTVVGSQTT